MMEMASIASMDTAFVLSHHKRRALGFRFSFASHCSESWVGDEEKLQLNICKMA